MPAYYVLHEEKVSGEKGNKYRDSNCKLMPGSGKLSARLLIATVYGIHRR
jgi:hypothetical protein